MEGSIHVNGRDIDLREIRSVWHRRPAPFRLMPGLSADEAEFAEGEVRAAFAGLLWVSGWFWVNHPDRIRAASSKLLQLKVAREVGLGVPRTLVTNDPEAVRRFYEECDGQIVYKTLGSPFIGSSGKGCLTTPVSRGHLERVDLIRNAPGIFQEYVPKRVEVRITVIGRKLFAAEIHSQANVQAQHDWRAVDIEKLRHCPHQLPPEIETKCLRLMEWFGLAYGAVDMILTPNDDYVFLENNPSGQFGWIEELTGLPLTAALADMLIAGQIL